MVFVIPHITQGVGAGLAMRPGLFVAFVLYGTLARRTGTILPGMAIHVLGDLARVLVFLVFHEGYHHGQIKLALEAAGSPIADADAGPVGMCGGRARWR